MIELEGEFLGTPLPNRPGNWVYRQLADCTVREVELTADEMRALRAKWEAEQLAAMKEINSHPLNQAAIELLAKGSGHNPFHMAVLDLAFHSLVEDDMPDWNPDMDFISVSLTNIARCRHLLAVLSNDAGLTPESFAGKSAMEAGRVVLAALRN